MKDNNNPSLLELSDEELDFVAGGISDHSALCGHMISPRCSFCVHQLHGQLVIQGELHDIIGCKRSPGPYGSIGGMVLAIKAAGPTPTQIY